MRKIRVITPIAALAVGIYIFLHWNEEKPVASPVSSHQLNSSSSSVSSVTAALSKNQPHSSRASIKGLISGSAFTREEFDNLSEWMSHRGYDTYENAEDYRTYSDEILTQLAKNGDFKAIGILVPKAIAAGDNKAAIQWINIAIVHGSTHHLDNLTILTSPDSTNDATEETRRPATLETLAVTKVMELRGDKDLAKVSKTTFVNSYKRLYGVDLILTDAEQQVVDQRAQELYDGYQEVRRSIGLGDFDNSRPSGVDKFFGSSK